MVDGKKYAKFGVGVCEFYDPEISRLPQFSLIWVKSLET